MFRRAKLRGAEAVLRTAIIVLPRNSSALLHLGGVRERLKDWAGAEAAYSAGIELGGSTMPRFLARRANVLAQQNRWSAAVADCAAHPDVVPPRRLLPRLAQHLRSEGRTPEAIDMIRSAIDERPTGTLLAALGACYEHLGDFDGALDAYERAIESAPKNLAIRNSLGELQSRRALIPFDVSHPDHRRLPDGVAKAALADAIAQLETVARKSESPWAEYRLGRAFESHGMFAEAMRAYDAALERLERVDKPWAHKAAASWRFRRSYVERRLSARPSDDPRLNRSVTAGPARDDVPGVAGFFEPKLTNIGLFLEGFVLPTYEGSIEICIDGSPITSVSGNRNSKFRLFKSTVVHNVLAEFPQESTLTMRVDHVPLITVGGSETAEISSPDGSGRLKELLQSGHSINKKGRWSSGPESAATTQEQLSAYDKARRFFAAQLGIELFVSYGTLLGCYRDGQPIPSDDDFDVSFVTEANSAEELKAEVREVIKALLRGGFDSRVAVDGRMFHLRVDDVVLDVNPFWFFDRRAWAFDAHALSRNDLVPVRSIEVAGFDVRIPARPEVFLEDNYGPDWRTPRSDFHYHRAQADRAVLRTAFLAPSEVRGLRDYSEQIRVELPDPGTFHGYGDPADPRFR